MIKQSLFNLQSIEAELQSAISLSTLGFNNSVGDVKFWAETELKRNIENQIQTWAQGLATNSKNDCCGNPPGSGFKVTFGIQILVSYKVRFKANLNIGYGQRLGDFGATTSFHLSAYNSGLGVGVNKKNLVVDVTAAANLTIGTGDGTPLPSYSLNYNSEIPMKNDFKNSFSYGQLYTWNSALNENKFSLDRLQREGMIGVRIGNVNISSANDTKKMGYFGIGTDMGYTGQLTIATPFLESGFQDFSGDYLKKEYEERKKKALDEKIKALKKDKTLSKDIKKAKIKKLKDDLTILTRKTYHNQTPYQKNLNKASTYLRFNHKNGYNTTIDFIGPAWLQNGIHNTIKDFKFEYEHKNIQGWVGKNF